LWPLLREEGLTVSRNVPKFAHGALVPLVPTVDGEARSLLLSYHPSQQNTFTRRLTEAMFDGVFSKARDLLGN
jgi:uracil-DNA glycosylase